MGEEGRRSGDVKGEGQGSGAWGLGAERWGWRGEAGGARRDAWSCVATHTPPALQPSTQPDPSLSRRAAPRTAPRDPMSTLQLTTPYHTTHSALPHSPPTLLQQAHEALL